jgi:hypothetical protein
MSMISPANSSCRRLLSLPLAGLLGLLLFSTACGSVTPPLERGGGPSAPPASGNLMLLHGVPDVAQLDLLVDGQRQVAGLAQRAASPLTPLLVGNHKVELRAPAAAAADPALWSGNVYVQDGQRLLLTALGRAADAQVAGSPTRLAVMAGKLSDAGAAGLLLRVLHASPALPNLEIANVSYKDPVPLCTVGFGLASSSVEVERPPGAGMLPLRLSLRQRGERFDLGSLTLSASLLGELAGHAQTLILLGETNPLAGDGSYFSAVLLDEVTGQLRDLPFEPNALGPKASLYMLHVSPDAGAIDLFSKVGGARLVGGLEYRQATPLLELVPTSYQLELRPASLTPVWLQAKLRLLPNMHWVLLLGGRQQGDSPTLRLQAVPRERPLADQTLRRALHTVADAPKDSRLTLTVAGGPTFVEPVASGAASPYRAGELTAGLLRMSLGGQSKQTWEIDLPQLVVDAANRGVFALYITGTLSEPRLPIAGLAVVESSATPTQAAVVVPLMTKLLPSP